MGPFAIGLAGGDGVDGAGFESRPLHAARSTTTMGRRLTPRGYHALDSCAGIDGAVRRFVRKNVRSNTASMTIVMTRNWYAQITGTISRRATTRDRPKPTSHASKLMHTRRNVSGWMRRISQNP